MRRKTGDTFKFNDKTYIVVERENLIDCCKCAFYTCLDCASHHMRISGECAGESRGDNKNVYFKLVE